MKRKIRITRCFLALLSIGVLCFFCIPPWFAQLDLLWSNIEEFKVDLNDNSGLQQFASTAEIGLKILYMFLRPLLAIAGAAMDNSLVYGGTFHLTEYLFKFRQFLRTFALYGLWFFFVGSIVASFFGYKQGEGTTRVRELLKKTAIATIAISMSRWMIAALIDLSTVTTVALWWLPLHALKEDKIFKETIYYLKPYTNRNLWQSTSKNADKQELSMLYGCTKWEKEAAETKFYLPCPIDNNWLFKKWDPKDPLTRESRKGAFVTAREWSEVVDTTKIQDNFCIYNKHIIQYNPGVDLRQCKKFEPILRAWNEEWVAQCNKVDELLTKATGMTWPLYALFWSILNMAELWITTNNGSVKEISLELIIKIVFWLALIIPLFALAIIMVVRVVILWLVIVFAPILTLAVAFWLEEKLQWLSDKVSIKNIISLIFLPTFAAFGISISIVFLSLLSNIGTIESKAWVPEQWTKQLDQCSNDALTVLGLKRSESPQWKTYQITAWSSLSMRESLRNTGANIVNIMSWLIVNSFWVALMRMVVFMTLKSNDFTKGIVDGIEGAAKSFMSTVPLIPIGWGIGLDALWSVWGKFQQEASKIANKQYQNLWLESLASDMAANNSDETKDFKAKFEESKDEAGNTVKAEIPDIASPSGLPLGNDFRSDFENAAPVYAKQAGETLSKDLSHIKDWESALKDPDFIKWMQDKWAYDNFLTNRDKQNSAGGREKNRELFESWLQSAYKATKIAGQKWARGYSYNNTLTTFTPWPGWNLTIKTRPYNPTINKASATKWDIESLDRILSNTTTTPTDSPLYNDILQETQNNNSTIAVEKTNYKVTKDPSGRITALKPEWK